MEDMMKTRRTGWFLLAGVIFCGLLISSGCEDAETGSGLILTPQDSALLGQGATVSITASMPDEDDEVILPLTWTVSNPSLGGILRSAGYTAVYESNGRIGQNVVICRDGLGREGLASVNQRREVVE